jgi:hypothetical protein
VGLTVYKGKPLWQTRIQLRGFLLMGSGFELSESWKRRVMTDHASPPTVPRASASNAPSVLVAEMPVNLEDVAVGKQRLFVAPPFR